MQKLHFVCKPNPDYYPFLGESYLYNSAAYLELKASKFGRPVTFYALRGELAVARIHFFEQQNSDGSLRAVSLPESPFGSLEFGEVTFEELKDFVIFITDQLRLQGVYQIVIKDCIAAYRSQKHISVENLLTEADYLQTESLPNHHIKVETGDLVSKLSSSKRRRIRLSQKAGFSIQNYKLASFNKIYDFLAHCYASKGRSLSLGKVQLQEQFYHYPQHWHQFVVCDGAEMIAACISVQVHMRILYTFYYAASSDYDFFSPTTLLLQGVHHFCKTHNIAILDLGTSNSDSVAHFKKHMGGEYTFKHTYLLNL